MESREPAAESALRRSLVKWLSKRWWLGLGVLITIALALASYFHLSSNSITYSNQGNCNAQGAHNSVDCSTRVNPTSSSPPVNPARTVTPGHRTPQDAVDGYLHSLITGDFLGSCQYDIPATQSQCLNVMGQVPSGYTVSVRNFGLGAIHIDGDRALVVVLGTFCQNMGSPRCSTNKDTNVDVDPSRSFTENYNSAVTTTRDWSTGYFATPLEKIDRRWYIVAIT